MESRTRSRDRRSMVVMVVPERKGLPVAYVVGIKEEEGRHEDTATSIERSKGGGSQCEPRPLDWTSGALARHCEQPGALSEQRGGSMRHCLILGLFPYVALKACHGAHQRSAYTNSPAC